MHPPKGGGWGSHDSREAGVRGWQTNNPRRDLGALAHEGGYDKGLATEEPRTNSRCRPIGRQRKSLMREEAQAHATS